MVGEAKENGGPERGAKRVSVAGATLDFVAGRVRRPSADWLGNCGGGRGRGSEVLGR